MYYSFFNDTWLIRWCSCHTGTSWPQWLQQCNRCIALLEGKPSQVGRAAVRNILFIKLLEPDGILSFCVEDEETPLLDIHFSNFNPSEVLCTNDFSYHLDLLSTSKFCFFFPLCKFYYNWSICKFFVQVSYFLNLPCMVVISQLFLLFRCLIPALVDYSLRS